MASTKMITSNSFSKSINETPGSSPCMPQSRAEHHCKAEHRHLDVVRARRPAACAYPRSDCPLRSSMIRSMRTEQVSAAMASDFAATTNTSWHLTPREACATTRLTASRGGDRLHGAQAPVPSSVKFDSHS